MPRLLPICGLLLFLLAGLIFLRPRPDGPVVVVYTSVDSAYAEALAAQFEAQTGIRVELRTDSEVSKTTGLLGRLRTLKHRPDGDVFWNSELSATLLLAREGLLEPYRSPEAEAIPNEYKDTQARWTGLGLRARVLIYNTLRVKPEEAPRTLEALADPRWKGRFCLARPLFGTTRSHLAALVLALGEERGLDLLRRIRDNARGSDGRWVVDGNAAVRDRVAEGVFELGLTDSDDVYAALDRHKPVGMVFLEQAPGLGWPGVFLIPNSVGLIKGGPHAEQGRRFIDFLLSPDSEAFLARQGARQFPVRSFVPVPQGHKRGADFQAASVDLEALAERIEPLSERITRLLEEGP